MAIGEGVAVGGTVLGASSESWGQGRTCPPAGCDSGEGRSAYCPETAQVQPRPGERVQSVQPGDFCGCSWRVLSAERSLGGAEGSSPLWWPGVLENSQTVHLERHLWELKQVTFSRPT